MSETVRVGLIGAGGNTQARHIPGLRAIDGVEIVAVCNRRPESTAAAAKEFGIPRTFERWQDLVAADSIDAIVIGTWPYLHCEITLAAFAAGKHVLTEARMAMNAAEAHRMLDASRRHPKLVAQIVPSPFGLTYDDHVRELIEGDFLGQVREIEVVSRNGAAPGDENTPLSWRQDVAALRDSTCSRSASSTRRCRVGAGGLAVWRPRRGLVFRAESTRRASGERSARRTA